MRLKKHSRVGHIAATLCQSNQQALSCSSSILCYEQFWLSMVSKKEEFKRSFQNGFVAVKNVKDGQTVNVKGKVLSKSAIVSFGYKLWNSSVFRAVGSSEASIA